MQDLYHQQLLEAAENKKNFGELADFDGEATSYNASCGDTVSIRIKLTSDGKQIESVGWTGTGCIISQAAMGQLSDYVVGKQVSDIMAMGAGEILELLALSKIAPGRLRCLLLGLTTIKKILQEKNT